MGTRNTIQVICFVHSYNFIVHDCVCVHIDYLQYVCACVCV